MFSALDYSCYLLGKLFPWAINHCMFYEEMNLFPLPPTLPPFVPFKLLCMIYSERQFASSFELQLERAQHDVHTQLHLLISAFAKENWRIQKSMP